jgi:hypothetical protein
MHVMSKSPLEREHTMTTKKLRHVLMIQADTKSKSPERASLLTHGTGPWTTAARDSTAQPSLGVASSSGKVHLRSSSRAPSATCGSKCAGATIE